MKIVYGLLIATLTLGAALLTVSFVHPGGLTALQEDLFGGDAADGRARGGDDGIERNGASPANAVTELAQAHQAYDRGDHDHAITLYTLARAFAANDTERRAAREGLDRALLANALVLGSPRAGVDRETARAEFDRLKAGAEARPSEQAWLAVARYAKGAGIDDGLVYVVERSLACARTGGPVEAQLRRSVGAGRRGRLVAQALETRGLNADPLDFATSSESNAGASPGDWEPEDEDGPSGIGAVGRVKVKRVPFGTFGNGLRRRLNEAVELEAKGETEHRAASPGSPDRAAHRKRALEHLLAAREIYNDAWEQDPKALGLERRIQHVQRMIYELHKDATIND